MNLEIGNFEVTWKYLSLQSLGLLWNPFLDKIFWISRFPASSWFYWVRKFPAFAELLPVWYFGFARQVWRQHRRFQGRWVPLKDHCHLATFFWFGLSFYYYQLYDLNSQHFQRLRRKSLRDSQSSCYVWIPLSDVFAMYLLRWQGWQTTEALSWRNLEPRSLLSRIVFGERSSEI